MSEQFPPKAHISSVDIPYLNFEVAFSESYRDLLDLNGQFSTLVCLKYLVSRKPTDAVNSRCNDDADICVSVSGI